MIININDNLVSVNRPSDSRTHKSMHGTTRQLIANAVNGVFEVFKKNLRLEVWGTKPIWMEVFGFAAWIFSDIYFEPPDGIEIKTNKTEIVVSGINKQLVGEVSAKIRSFRKPEPYKGKRY